MKKTGYLFSAAVILSMLAAGCGTVAEVPTPYPNGNGYYRLPPPPHYHGHYTPGYPLYGPPGPTGVPGNGNNFRPNNKPSQTPPPNNNSRPPVNNSRPNNSGSNGNNRLPTQQTNNKPTINTGNGSLQKPGTGNHR